MVGQRDPGRQRSSWGLTGNGLRVAVLTRRA
ncbi:hypothetical protein EPYR_01161 [Erwinia pyrifoliae DSM 12163]|nr:hypothetical protein EPYR_01161 [Erwinia pyrifoliae DSM 12163]